MSVIEKVSGGLLVVIGLLLLTGRFAMLSGWLLDSFPVLGTIG
jgi:cytochrome c-type biogenesis protein